MNAVDLYTRCDAAFRERLAAVDGRWAAPTALPGWDVRALVHHMVVEERWAPPIFAGLSIGEVGDIFEGDQLVPDPLTAARDASGAALDAVREEGAMERTVQLSFGETLPRSTRGSSPPTTSCTPGTSRAPSASTTPSTPRPCRRGRVVRAHRGAWREAGVIGPRVPVPDDADEQTRMLAMFGRAA